MLVSAKVLLKVFLLLTSLFPLTTITASAACQLPVTVTYVAVTHVWMLNLLTAVLLPPFHPIHHFVLMVYQTSLVVVLPPTLFLPRLGVWVLGL